MIKHFMYNEDAIRFLHGKNPDQYSVGTDKYNQTIIKKNNWFNTSWLGRKIEQLFGNDFSQSDKKIKYLLDNMDVFFPKK